MQMNKTFYTILIICTFLINHNLLADSKNSILDKVPTNEDILPVIRMQQNIVKIKKSNCLFSDTATDMPGINLQDDSKYHDIFMPQAYCELLTKVERVVTPLYEKILKTKTIPTHAYMFSIFIMSINDRGDDIYTKEDMGLFANLSACKLLEEYAKQSDIPIKKCRKIDDFFKFLIN